MITYAIVDGAVCLYEDGNDKPFLYQPHWPDGTDWADGEAEAWAQQAVLALTDPTADDAGDNPEQPTKPKIVIEDETPPTE